MRYKGQELEQKVEREELSLGYQILDKVVELSIYGAVLALSALPVYQMFKPLYDGPVNVPGVQQVTVSPIWLPKDSGFNSAEYAGNTVEIAFSDGLVARVRDYNGDFTMNNGDTIAGAFPEQVLLSLAAAKEKVKEKNAQENAPQDRRSLPLMF